MPECMTDDKTLMESIYVTKPYLPPLSEYIPYLERIWESGHLTNNGPLHQEFERALTLKFGWSNVTLFANGHLALEIALKSLELPEGSEIITTPFTFVSTTAAIVNQGFVPVFCDITDNFTIDTKQIESLITDKTAAIMPVHVYGFPCDVEHIADLAERHKLKVIYDAAHAIGVRVNGCDISEYGDISMFSFHATKLFHTVEGGALVFANCKLKTKMDMYKNFGISGSDSIDCVGLNAKMNEFEAAMGLSCLSHFDEIITIRKEIYDRYLSNLRYLDGIQVYPIPENVVHNYAYMPILINEKRDEVYDVLVKENIYPRKYFYPSLSKVECYKKYIRKNMLTNTEVAVERVLCLPIYATLSLSQVDDVCNIIASIE